MALKFRILLLFELKIAQVEDFGTPSTPAQAIVFI